MGGRSGSSSSSGSSSDSDDRDRRHRKDKKRKKEKHKKKKHKKEHKEKKRKRDRDDDDDRFEIQPLMTKTKNPKSAHRQNHTRLTVFDTRTPRRREKEILAQAKKYLRQQGLVPAGPGGGVGGGIEAAAAAVSKASKSSAASTENTGGALTAAQLAAKRVAEARASALEEDAMYARVGAPREGLLDFRTRGVDAVALAGDGENGGLVKEKGLTPAEAKKARRDAKERAEELAPRATGRDALREKRMAVRESHRSFAARKDEEMLGGMVRGDEFGGGGGDEFQAALAARQRAQARRDKRRGVDPAAVAARVGAYRSREEEKMSQFHELVGGFGGERMNIPERR
jgi:hypothetical protein